MGLPGSPADAGLQLAPANQPALMRAATPVALPSFIQAVSIAAARRFPPWLGGLMSVTASLEACGVAESGGAA